MAMVEQSCESFVEALASKAPVPGGGGASALVGAIGMALGSMVGSLTLGRKKYAHVQEDIEKLMVRSEALQRKLLELVDRDAEAFEPLSRAYSMPGDTGEQRAEKERVMERCLRDACAVPLEIMESACGAIDLLEEYAARGTAIAISDVGVGAACCRAALNGAALNVFINTKSMKDREYAAAVNEKAERMIAAYTEKADRVFAEVRGRF